MKAMILAAGRGQRMRPLTDTCPKPMLKVAGKPLLLYHIEKLVAMGIDDIVINHAWLGEQIEAAIGDGRQWGANVRYSPEVAGGLETAGGIRHALPLLGSEPFVVVNGDIWTDYDFACLPNDLAGDLAHLVLVNNPAHNAQGDFGLTAAELKLPHSPIRVLAKPADICYTFSGIGVYHPDLFKDVAPGKVPLAPLLRQMMVQQKVTGQLFQGHWTDVGTVERLAQLEHFITMKTVEVS